MKTDSIFTYMCISFDWSVCMFWQRCVILQTI